jgi:hypothetical protein
MGCLHVLVDGLPAHPEAEGRDRHRRAAARHTSNRYYHEILQPKLASNTEKIPQIKKPAFRPALIVVSSGANQRLSVRSTSSPATQSAA